MTNIKSNAMKCIFVTIAILLIMISSSLYGRETEVPKAVRDELIKIIPQDILNKCIAARARNMEYLINNPPMGEKYEPDTSMMSRYFLQRIHDARYLNLYNKSYILTIMGCCHNLAIFLLDSANNHNIISRLKPNLKLYSGYFYDLVFPFKDINGDSIPEMAVLFSWGGIGSEIRFLAVARDSLYFLKTENGLDSFGLLRGQLKLIDIENDGIMEIYTREFDIYNKTDYCALYKWDGLKYILVNKDCREEK